MEFIISCKTQRFFLAIITMYFFVSFIKIALQMMQFCGDKVIKMNKKYHAYFLEEIFTNEIRTKINPYNTMKCTLRMTHV